jgi:hypothetical protein
MKQLEEFNAMVNKGIIPMFEMAVTNKDGEDDYVIFDIVVDEKGVTALWEGDAVFVEWDEDKNLDWHLNELCSICVDALSEKDYIYGHKGD